LWIGIHQAEAVEEAEATTRRGGRRQRFTREQKRQIVEATLTPGACVARVAREVGVNANQVFAWRRSYKQGLLEERGGSVKLLPVSVAREISSEVKDGVLSAAEVSARPAGSIHMELPGKALLTVEGRASAESLRLILEHLLR
jgi:transposase